MIVFKSFLEKVEELDTLEIIVPSLSQCWDV